ncbi:MAG: anthranilate synthase component II [Elusimicrobiota bacterium]
MKIIVIDNYDSFVYNLCDYLGRNPEVNIEVFRNDEIKVKNIIGKNPDGVVISPGPGHPKEAGISIELIKKLPSDIPLLGVCLGHQCLARAFGGSIGRAKKILHGKTSLIYYDNEEEVFNGLNNPFKATRYHSLIVKKIPLDNIKIIAQTDEEEIMGIKHKSYPFYGLQFHPESILTEKGVKITRNFISIIREYMNKKQGNK